MKNKTSVGFAGWLTIVMVAAKAFGYASYSWWFAFLPVWVALGLIALFLLIVFIIALVQTFNK